jgi:opacity protein-like surface antigen
LQAGENGQDRGWWISAGVNVRRVSVDFNVAAPLPFSRADFVSTLKDRGDIGLYEGIQPLEGSNPTEYENGKVGITDFNDGSCTFIADSNDQVGVDPLSTSATRMPVRTVTFASTRHDLWHDVQAIPGDASDDETVVSPFVQINTDALFSNGRLQAYSRYGYQTSSHHSGWQDTSRATVYRKKKTYHHTYSVDERWADGPFPSFPGAGETDGVVFDAARYNTFPYGDVIREPRTWTRTATQEAGTFMSGYSSSLDLDRHEISLGARYEFPLSSRCSIVAGAGVSLNLFAFDFTTAEGWVRDDTGETVSLTESDDNGSKTRLGCSGHLGIDYDLVRSGRYFVHLDASAEWVDDFSVSAGNASADVDASSFGATIGLGCVIGGTP